MLRAESVEHFDLAGVALTRIRRRRLYESVLKRLLDLALACIAVIAISPVWLVIVVAIRLDSPGPAIFVQDRVGRKGTVFRFYKFRSMYVDAEERLAELQAHNETDGPVFKMRNDPRVSRVGALLRQTSLDELPQLINVLKGEMSLVGPRPPLPKEVAHYRPGDAIRLSVKPGLTCLWQIRGRSTVGFEQWMELDREYIRNMSLWFDVGILVRTVGAVLSMKGAY